MRSFCAASYPTSTACSEGVAGRGIRRLSRSSSTLCGPPLYLCFSSSSSSFRRASRGNDCHHDDNPVHHHYHPQSGSLCGARRGMASFSGNSSSGGFSFSSAELYLPGKKRVGRTITAGRLSASLKVTPVSKGTSALRGASSPIRPATSLPPPPPPPVAAAGTDTRLHASTTTTTHNSSSAYLPDPPTPKQPHSHQSEAEAVAPQKTIWQTSSEEQQQQQQQGEEVTSSVTSASALHDKNRLTDFPSGTTAVPPLPGTATSVAAFSSFAPLAFHADPRDPSWKVTDIALTLEALENTLFEPGHEDLDPSSNALEEEEEAMEVNNSSNSTSSNSNNSTNNSKITVNHSGNPHEKRKEDASQTSAAAGAAAAAAAADWEPYESATIVRDGSSSDPSRTAASAADAKGLPSSHSDTARAIRHQEKNFTTVEEDGYNGTWKQQKLLRCFQQHTNHRLHRSTGMASSSLSSSAVLQFFTVTLVAVLPDRMNEEASQGTASPRSGDTVVYVSPNEASDNTHPTNHHRRQNHVASAVLQKQLEELLFILNALHYHFSWKTPLPVPVPVYLEYQTVERHHLFHPHHHRSRLMQADADAAAGLPRKEEAEEADPFFHDRTVPHSDQVSEPTSAAVTTLSKASFFISFEATGKEATESTDGGALSPLQRCEVMRCKEQLFQTMARLTHSTPSSVPQPMEPYRGLRFYAVLDGRASRSPGDLCTREEEKEEKAECGGGLWSVCDVNAELALFCQDVVLRSRGMSTILTMNNAEVMKEEKEEGGVVGGPSPSCRSRLQLGFPSLQPSAGGVSSSLPAPITLRRLQQRWKQLPLPVNRRLSEALCRARIDHDKTNHHHHHHSNNNGGALSAPFSPHRDSGSTGRTSFSAVEATIIFPASAEALLLDILPYLHHLVAPRELWLERGGINDTHSENVVDQKNKNSKREKPFLRSTNDYSGGMWRMRRTRLGSCWAYLRALARFTKEVCAQGYQRMMRSSSSYRIARHPIPFYGGGGGPRHAASSASQRRRLRLLAYGEIALAPMFPRVPPALQHSLIAKGFAWATATVLGIASRMMIRGEAGGSRLHRGQLAAAAAALPISSLRLRTDTASNALWACPSSPPSPLCWPLLLGSACYAPFLFVSSVEQYRTACRGALLALLREDLPPHSKATTKATTTTTTTTTEENQTGNLVSTPLSVRGAGWSPAVFELWTRRARSKGLDTAAKSVRSISPTTELVFFHIHAHWCLHESSAQQEADLARFVQQQRLDDEALLALVQSDAGGEVPRGRRLVVWMDADVPYATKITVIAQLRRLGIVQPAHRGLGAILVVEENWSSSISQCASAVLHRQQGGRDSGKEETLALSRDMPDSSSSSSSLRTIREAYLSIAPHAVLITSPLSPLLISPSSSVGGSSSLDAAVQFYDRVVFRSGSTSSSSTSREMTAQWKLREVSLPSPSTAEEAVEVEEATGAGDSASSSMRWSSLTSSQRAQLLCWYHQHAYAAVAERCGAIGCPYIWTNPFSSSALTAAAVTTASPGSLVLATPDEMGSRSLAVVLQWLVQRILFADDTHLPSATTTSSSSSSSHHCYYYRPLHHRVTPYQRLLVRRALRWRLRLCGDEEAVLTALLRVPHTAASEHQGDGSSLTTTGSPCLLSSSALSGSSTSSSVCSTPVGLTITKSEDQWLAERCLGPFVRCAAYLLLSPCRLLSRDSAGHDHATAVAVAVADVVLAGLVTYASALMTSGVVLSGKDMDLLSLAVLPMHPVGSFSPSSSCGGLLRWFESASNGGPSAALREALTVLSSRSPPDLSTSAAAAVDHDVGHASNNRETLFTRDGSSSLCSHECLFPDECLQSPADSSAATLSLWADCILQIQTHFNKNNKNNNHHHHHTDRDTEANEPAADETVWIGYGLIRYLVDNGLSFADVTPELILRRMREIKEDSDQR